jgi:hypothetical protein
MTSFKKEADAIIAKHKSNQIQCKCFTLIRNEILLVKYDTTESSFEIRFNGKKKLGLSVHVPSDYPKDPALIFSESDAYDVSGTKFASNS